tara:strand:- start:9008 stop:9829 length:822 start_codon:yes stop_codon:yes gene_type:complete
MPYPEARRSRRGRSVYGGGGAPPLVQRFFTTTTVSGSQHWTIPQVLSGESITMDVYPTNGNTGLPTGAPAVTDNVYQTITFTLTGNMDYINRNGASYFNGITANVLVDGRIYKIDEDWAGQSTVLKNSSAVLGNNTVLLPTPFQSDLIGGASIIPYDAANIVSGVLYLVRVVISNYQGTGTVGIISDNGVPSGENSIEGNGVLEFLFTADSTATQRFFSRGTNQCTFSESSFRQADGYGTAVNVTSADADSYILNGAGTVWENQEGGSDLDIA